MIFSKSESSFSIFELPFSFEDYSHLVYIFFSLCSFGREESDLSVFLLSILGSFCYWDWIYMRRMVPFVRGLLHFIGFSWAILTFSPASVRDLRASTWDSYFSWWAIWVVEPAGQSFLPGFSWWSPPVCIIGPYFCGWATWAIFWGKLAHFVLPSIVLQKQKYFKFDPCSSCRGYCWALFGKSL